MQLTNTARENFIKLFGKEKFPLSVSDKEFFEGFINFALDEALTQSKLEIQEYIKIALAALIAIPSLREFEIILSAAMRNGINPVEIKEILYQAVPYVGFGCVSSFITATNAIFKEHNISLPLQSQRTTNKANRQEKGLNIQRQIFGVAIDKGNAEAPQDEKHIRTFLSANCFGDYYTRNGLDLRFRELLTFVYLSALGGVDAQVKAHVSGNVNVGNGRDKLIAVITALIPYIGYPKALNAIAAIDAITLQKPKQN
ncbi:carboxymuconolactone decarboxylase family protein [Helicobacter sp. Faydin-H64]|uniref:Carboxymuconolactone decarboxylase family protein n=2 Tax=Helicobacter turcicus TaxID=2867412 RepID=A0ABS7JNV4_9HELI|nr:carboxymuconolactone decarboxylase family protein [Helicobacter turcicus]MBX7491095.1 carboxymuconolactone decarboxylase family protein [Helicobacter turcicus]MBX7545960.1 carboxymuconolactone decarboxylase family protein [Helicobacter turcicus]